MAINSAANTKVYIGPTTAAADATAYAALSWTEIKEVESLPAFGDSASTINFTALADARVRKRKGARDAGQLAFNCAHDPLDPGQLAAIAAEQTVANLTTPGTPGLSRVVWDLKPSNDVLTQYGGEGRKFVKPGEYTVTMTIGKTTVKQKLVVTIAAGIETR